MGKPFPTLPPARPGSLAEALAAVPEPRRPYGWRTDTPPIPLVALLQLAVVATLCGARSLYAIAQWGRERVEEDPELLTALGLPLGRSPCVATLHRVFKVLDVDAFEQAVSGWLLQTGLDPTDPLALDGKTLRGIHGENIAGVHLVAAYSHHAGEVVHQLCTEGKGQELAAVAALLPQLPLAGRLVTGDALLTQRTVCTQIVEQGGDYLLTVKDNQPSLRADLEAVFSPVDGDRTGRLGPPPHPGLGEDGAGGTRGAVRGAHPGGTESSAWTAGSADVVAPG